MPADSMLKTGKVATKKYFGACSAFVAGLLSAGGPREVHLASTSHPTIPVNARDGIRRPLGSRFPIPHQRRLEAGRLPTREMAGLALRPVGLLAAAVIVTQLGGSFLFLTRRCCWLGAGTLAVFTILATLLAHRFWEVDVPHRALQMATFFEHTAIVGGLAVSVVFVNGRREVR